MNHTKPIAKIIERIDANMHSVSANYTPEPWQMLGGDAHHCDTLGRMNAPQIKRDRAFTRKVLIVVCIAFGMTLAAVALSHGYDRALDAIAVPHLEGF